MLCFQLKKLSHKILNGKVIEELETLQIHFSVVYYMGLLDNCLPEPAVTALKEKHTMQDDCCKQRHRTSSLIKFKFLFKKTDKIKSYLRMFENVITIYLHMSLLMPLESINYELTSLFWCFWWRFGFSPSLQ